MNENLSLLVLQIMQGLQTLLSRTSRIAMELKQLRHEVAQLAESQAFSGDDDDDDDGGIDYGTLQQFLKGITEESPTGTGAAPQRRPRTAPPIKPVLDVEKIIQGIKGDGKGGDE